MKVFLLLFFPILCCAADAPAFTTPFLNEIHHGSTERFKAPWLEVSTWLERNPLNERQTLLLTERILRERDFPIGNNLGLDQLLRTILKGKPGVPVLTAAVLILKRAHEMKNPVANTPQLLKLIEEKAPVDGAASVFESIANFELAEGVKDVKAPLPLSEIGVVKVASIYENGGKAKKESGTGNIIEKAGKKYLLTDAHLLHGKDPQIEIEGKSFPIDAKSILFDSDNDLATAQISLRIPAALAFDLQSRDFRPSREMQRALNQGRASSIYMGDQLLDNANGENPFGPNGGWETGNANIEYRAISPPWARGKESFELNQRVGRGHVELVSEGKRLHMGVKTAPGMSGTILLSIPSEGKVKASGILAQYNPYLDSSYFTTMEVARSLLENYEAGRRGGLTPTTWKMRNGLTYRDYGDGTAEANFVLRASGNGTYADPGNGTYADPGNGTYADPGNGTYADPGESERLAAELNQCIEQKYDFSPFTSANDVVRFIRENLSTTPEHAFTKMRIRPGMRWQGKAVIGFQAKPKNGNGPMFLLFANPEAVSFMRTHADAFAFEPVSEGADLLPFLKQKLIAAFPNESSLIQGKETRFKSTDFYDKPADLRLIVKENTLELAPFGLKLDAKGRQPGQQTFLPIITLNGKGSAERTVDLRGLFFTDLTDVSQDYTKDAKGRSVEILPNPETFAEALRLHNTTPKIETRVGSHEQSINLAPETCDVNRFRPGNPDFLAAGKYTRWLCR